MTLAEPIVFNPLDPNFRKNPYPVYQRILREDPVHTTMFGVRAFSRYADCQAILRDHKHFSSDDRKSPLYGTRQEAFSTAIDATGADIDVEDRPFLFMDPPDHTRMRRLVNTAFTPRAVEALRPRIQEIVTDLLDAAEQKGEIEVIGDLAYPLPVKVICEMLGVPAEDHEHFKGWSAVLASSLDPDIAFTPEKMRERVTAISDSKAYFRQLIARRREDPRDDILSALIAVEAEGDKLSEPELISTCRLILIAGHETTVNLIGNGVLQLLRHPDELARFKADPDLAPSVVEEVLRFDPPVQFDGRMCLEETDVGGVTVQANEFVMQLLGAANRDPEHFENPDRFDITRDDSSHMSFGYGIHFCLGAPLARIEGQIALRTLVERCAKLRLLTEDPPYKAMITLRGLESLPVGI